MWKKIWDALLDLFTKDPPREIREIDLGAELDAKAAADGRGLKWRESLVDFLTLLGIDASKENRAELAKELGVEGKPGTASHNEALRKAVFKELSDNGGQVPSDLLD